MGAIQNSAYHTIKIPRPTKKPNYSIETFHDVRTLQISQNTKILTKNEFTIKKQT